tara:strand:- start:287 stop:451 length:165 start_codon:yes stop_codon:yes gene_type:complete
VTADAISDKQLNWLKIFPLKIHQFSMPILAVQLPLAVILVTGKITFYMWDWVYI